VAVLLCGGKETFVRRHILRLGWHCTTAPQSQSDDTVSNNELMCISFELELETTHSSI
jgi:hypothetical protein